MFHIVFGESATGGVRHAFRQTEDEVIGFPVDLSVGPVRAIDQDEGITRHFSWVRETFHPMFSDPDRQEAQFREARGRVREIPAGSKVTVWTGQNAAEQAGLRLACVQLGSRELDIHTVDTFRAMRHFSKEPGTTVDIRHTGELSADQIHSFYRTDREPLSGSRRQELTEEGEALLRSDGMVRSWTDDSLIEEPETRDDALILDCVKRVQGQSEGDWILAVRAVGEAMGHAAQTVHDGWIESRIQALVRSGLLEAEGDLTSIRMYKIRLAPSK